MPEHGHHAPVHVHKSVVLVAARAGFLHMTCAPAAIEMAIRHAFFGLALGDFAGLYVNVATVLASAGVGLFPRADGHARLLADMARWNPLLDVRNIRFIRRLKVHIGELR
jgi:hypothetical protein